MVIQEQQKIQHLKKEAQLEPDCRWGELIDPADPSKGKWMPLHEHQKVCYESNHRFTAAIAGTGGGKTVLGPLWCLKHMVSAINKYNRVLGLVVAPTYKVLARATMPAFVDTLRYTQFEGRYLESKSYYELPNNWGRIWAQGADNPGGLEGGQFDFVWGDEGGQFRKKTFDAIIGRTGAKMAPILITTTPYGLGPLYHDWYKRWKAGDKNYFIRQWASHINPGYPDEEYQRAKGSMTPEKFAERYDGKFSTAEGLVYPAFPRTEVSLSKNEIQQLIESEGKFYGGLDFGWNDPFCGLCGILKPDDTLWIWYERYRSQRTIEDHASSLPKFFDKQISWFADHNPDHIRRLRKGGHHVRRAKKDILTGILAVNNRIYNNKLKIISNRCPAIIAESETYIYPNKDDEIIGDKPVDKDNHAMDSLRYLIMGIDYRKAA